MADPKKGTGKKPKGSGRRLYTDENPKDTVGIKFATPTDARKTVAKVDKLCEIQSKSLPAFSKLGYWKTKIPSNLYELIKNVTREQSIVIPEECHKDAILKICNEKGKSNETP